MLLKRSLLVLAFLFFIISSFGQKIVYSEPEKDDSRRMDFEIIGKVSGNFLVYKKIRSQPYVGIYNNEMMQVDKQEQEYLPEDRVINIDFFPYNDFAYVIYQYQKKNVVYCDAVKINGMGKKIS